MSRVGKRPITIPGGVTVTLKSGGLEVKGPNGMLFQEFMAEVTIKVEDGTIKVSTANDSREAHAAHGLTRTLISNMVEGVTKGFQKRLEIVGVGYKAEVKGASLVMALGFSHPVTVDIPKGITVKAEKPTLLAIEGADRQAVGQFAASVRALRSPEPYKGKGIKYVDERIRRKVGKAGVAAGAK